MLIAVDPGTTTGIACLFEDDDVPQTVEVPWCNAVRIVEDYIINRATPLRSGVGAIVCEKFDITPTTHKLTQAGTHDALDAIGALHYVARKHGVPFLKQSRTVKAIADNDALRRLGWWHKGGGGHANDALRHLVAYRVRECGWRPEALLRW